MVENCVRRLAHVAGTRSPSSHPRRGGRGAQADDVRRTDHHDRLSADPDAGRRRGQDVPADGPDGHLRPGRLDDSVADAHAGAGQPGAAETPEGTGAAVGATGPTNRRRPAHHGLGGRGLRRQPFVRVGRRFALLSGRPMAGGGRRGARAFLDAPCQTSVLAATEGDHALQVCRGRLRRLRPGHGLRLHRPEPRLRVHAQAVGRRHLH